MRTFASASPRAPRASGGRTRSGCPRRRPHSLRATSITSSPTSSTFRGIWGTTPSAIAEIHRVLVPGGRLGLTVWGHIKASSGAWALTPFRMAAPQKVENQAAMVALGRPGVGEELLAQYGFVDIERIEDPYVWEFTDPEVYARAIASTGPAYEAIQNVGEDFFSREASEVARAQIRDGLPLRASIKVVGFIGVKPNE
jgi:hypothetical protein